MDLAAYAVAENDPFGDDANGIDSPSVGQSPRRTYAFCSEQNLDQCARYINQELSALGFMPLSMASASTHLSPRRDGSETMIRFVNCIYELLQQHRHDMSLVQQKENKIQFLSSEVSIQRATQTHLREQLQATEREAAGCTERERQCNVINKSLNAQVRSLKDELRRVKSDHQHRISQLNHENRKLERDATKLKDRLSSQSSQRGTGGQLSQLRLLNDTSRLDRKRANWSKPGGSHEVEMYKNVIGKHEQRQHELITENAELRDMLTGLQQEVSSVLRKSSVSEAQSSGSLSSSDLERHGSSASPGQPSLPARVVRQQDLPHSGFLRAMEENLLSRWEALKEELDRPTRKRPTPPSSPSLPHYQPVTPRSVELEVLRKKLTNYEQLLAEKETELQAQLDVKLGSERRRPHLMSASKIAAIQDRLDADRVLVRDERHRLEEERGLLMQVAQEMDKEREAQIEAAPRPMDSVIREAHEFLDSSLFAQASSASPTLESSPLVNGDRSQSGTPPSSNGSQSILTTHVPYCRTASPIHLPRSHSKSKHHGRTPKHVSGSNLSWVAHSPLANDDPLSPKVSSHSVASTATSTPHHPPAAHASLRHSRSTGSSLSPRHSPIPPQSPASGSAASSLPPSSLRAGSGPDSGPLTPRSSRPSTGVQTTPTLTPRSKPAREAVHLTPQSSPRSGTSPRGSSWSPSHRLAMYLDQNFSTLSG